MPPAFSGIPLIRPPGLRDSPTGFPGYTQTSLGPPIPMFLILSGLFIDCIEQRDGMWRSGMVSTSRWCDVGVI